jgi:hypothetical protein
MKRALILTLLLLAAVVAAQGQGRGRPWKRGALQLEEFAVTAASGRENSHLDYGIVYSTSGTTEGMNTYIYCRTSALMYPTASWMAEGHADEAELTYNQVLFDLVEVYRRQMQQDAILLSKRVQYEALLATTMNHLDREMQVIRAATEMGRDSLAVERIRVKNREWLNANPGNHPAFTPLSYWWCLGIEGGVSFSTGDVGRLISPSIGATGYMGAFGWGRHGLYFSVLNAVTLARDSAYNFEGDRVLPVMYRNDVNLLGYGYTLFDRQQFSITPYVAFGVTNMDTEMDWYIGTSYTFGVRGLYHFHHWHHIKDGAKGKARRFTPSAMANLYVSYTDLDVEGKGLTFGLSLGLTLGIRRESVTWMND